MKFRFTGLSDPGLIRSANQDAYHIDPEGRFVIVADGMGGHAGGEQASNMATSVIQKYLVKNYHSDKSCSALLQGSFLEANSAIVQDQRTHRERSDMGTTVVAVIFRNSETWVAHIGDSRLYCLRSSQLNQITEDHTWVAKALKSGDITPEESRVHPYRHILSRCLGREDMRQVDVQQIDLQMGDRLLLCSDGLTEEVTDPVIASELQFSPIVEKAAIALVNTAKANGGRDNITVIIVEVNDSKE